MENSPARKLVALLENASPEDRLDIVTWLLERPAGPGSAAHVIAGSMLQMQVERRRQVAVLEQVGRGAAPGEERQPVTFTLPPDQYARLRRWCGEQHFSIPAVVRGLVDRFLDDQPDAGRPADAP